MSSAPYRTASSATSWLSAQRTTSAEIVSSENAQFPTSTVASSVFAPANCPGATNNTCRPWKRSLSTTCTDDQSIKTSRINKKGNSQQRNPTCRNQHLLQEMTIIGAVQNRHIPEKPALLATQNAAGVRRTDITAINASRASQNPSTKYRMKTTSTWHF